MDQTTRPTVPSIPSVSVNEYSIVIHVITWIAGVETIKRQTGTVRVVV